MAGDATIVMMESFPPQVSLQGGFGDVVFEATAGTFAGGNTGCAGSRATTSAGQSVTFNPPDSGVYTIRAVYASSHGAVSVATEMSVGSAASGCPEDLVSLPTTTPDMNPARRCLDETAHRTNCRAIAGCRWPCQRQRLALFALRYVYIYARHRTTNGAHLTPRADRFRRHRSFRRCER